MRFQSFLKRWRRTWLCAGLLLPVWLMGCNGPRRFPFIDNGATIVPGSLPEPQGVYVRRFQDAHSIRAEADDFVIYDFMWYYDEEKQMSGTKLTYFGAYQLDQMTRRLAREPFPVLLQPHLDPEINRVRRQVIIDHLNLNGIPDAEMRVLLGFPEAEGMHGIEAEMLGYQMLQSSAYGGYGGGIGGLSGITPFSGFRGAGGFGGGFGGFGGY